MIVFESNKAFASIGFCVYSFSEHLHENYIANNY
ncbi:hypothetical protein BH10BAC4_BH10BAC4_23320 [soil metagenome]